MKREDMRICVNCKYVSNSHGGSRRGPDRKTWFYWYCKHPDLERPKVIDPVTGNEVYAATNDFGRMCPTDGKHPHCRDINTDGQCQYYEVSLMGHGMK